MSCPPDRPRSYLKKQKARHRRRTALGGCRPGSGSHRPSCYRMVDLVKQLPREESELCRERSSQRLAGFGRVSVSMGQRCSPDLRPARLTDTTWICKPGQSDDLCAGTIDGTTTAPARSSRRAAWLHPADERAGRLLLPLPDPERAGHPELEPRQGPADPAGRGPAGPHVLLGLQRLRPDVQAGHLRRQPALSTSTRGRDRLREREGRPSRTTSRTTTRVVRSSCSATPRVRPTPAA